jgi:mercuric reductase
LTQQYDIVIVGRGAGAFSSAIKASELSEGKATIAMVGTGPIGGTCVNVGCVPSKYLLEASHRHYYPQRNHFPGIGATHPSLDFKEVMKGLRTLVGGFREAKYDKVLALYPNVEIFEGKGRFRAPTEVEVLNGKAKVLEARNVVIATGSRPTAPPIEGLRDAGYITSDTVWSLDERPKRLAVIGGGAIGLELGQAFLHFGSEVTVIEALPRIIAPAESQISEILQRRLSEEGMRFLIKARIKRIERVNGSKVLDVVTAEGKTKVEADQILVATGRAPNTDGLSLKKAGVEIDQGGSIKVDSTMKTTSEKVYAAGDCVSKKLMLETLAAREGVIAATNIAGGKAKVDYLSTPWAVFTNPQIAAVGYTEEEFVEKTGTCSCRTIGLDKVAKAEMLGETDGLVKLIIDPTTGKVVGLHALSPSATEFALEGAMAIKYGLTFKDIVETTHIFPTLAEGVKLTAQAFLRNIDAMSCCVE